MFADLSGIDIIVFVVSLVIGLTIHEAMHGFVANWLGDDTAHQEGRLTLNPLAHIDTVTTVLLPTVLILLHLPPILAAKPVPVNFTRLKYDEFGGAMVALAGPLTNLALAALAAIFFRAGGWEPLILFASVNVGLFVFNMIPFPPLDGSRLLYAFAPEGLRRIMEQIEAMGFFFLLMVILLFYQFIATAVGNVMETILRFLLV